jgi:hypothetical protein
MGIVFGLFGLAHVLGRSAKAGISELANPRFTTMAFAELPAWVRERLAGVRDQFAALGFNDLTTYTQHTSRLNYNCVFVSPDGLTQATTWVARKKGLTLWAAAPFMGWSAFKNELLALPRFGFTARFPDGRLLETSPVEILAKGHVAGETEFVLVPPGLPMGEVKERHEAAVRAFAARRGVEPVRITTVDAFLDCERALSVRIAERVRRETAG